MGALEYEIEMSLKTESLCESLVASIPAPFTTRIALVLAAFSLCRQHAQAVAFLSIHVTFDSSAQALIRPTFEAGLRAEWLLLLAEEKHFARISKHKDGVWPDLEALAKMIDAHTSQEIREHILQQDRKHLNSFTHGGTQAVGRHLLNLGVPNTVWHDPDECAAVVKRVRLMVASLGITIAHHVGQYNIAGDLLSISNSPTDFA